jgi:F420H(2)-dependent quinone reductase
MLFFADSGERAVVQGLLMGSVVAVMVAILLLIGILDAPVPPSWFVHTAWRVHRALYRLSGGRFLWTTSSKRGWGALRLTTMGRKSGQERSVIIGYLEDGPNLVAIAMNGWDEGHPSWWLNSWRLAMAARCSCRPPQPPW